MGIWKVGWFACGKVKLRIFLFYHFYVICYPNSIGLEPNLFNTVSAPDGIQTPSVAVR